MPTLINRLIARHFLMWVGIVLIALLGLAALGGLVENLKLAQKIGGTTGQAILLTVYGMPPFISNMAPFVFLFASLITYMRLNDTQAIAVFRSAGQSVWQFSAPVLIATLILATATIFIIDPIASYSEKLRDQLENRILGRDDQLNILSTGVWIRIVHAEGHDLLHGRSVVNADTMQLDHVDLYRYAANGQLVEHITAGSARLTGDMWRLNTAQGDLQIAAPQGLSGDGLRDRLLSSHSVPIWRLPTVIDSGEHAGLDMTHQRMRFHTLLALPFFCMFMVLIAIAFSLPRGRIASTGRTVVTAIIMGFGAYAGSQLVSKIAQLSLLPVAAAAWIPTLVLLLITLSVLIEREER